ncbi:2-C-methyl-D-erythritol 2,4-cyclodiphosphate synthase [Pseudochelatococcus sp. B33]
MASTDIAAVIVAAGRGLRASAGHEDLPKHDLPKHDLPKHDLPKHDLPKQYRPLAGVPVLARTLDAFLGHPGIARVQAVIGADDIDRYERAIAALSRRDGLLAPVVGGSTRQESVFAGLHALRNDPPAVVLVHDGARPFVSAALIDAAIAAARAHAAAIPGTSVTDTIKLVDDRDRVAATPERARLRAVQTPQAFDYRLLLGAHARARAEGLSSFTDDGALAEWAGSPVTVFPGDPDNVKLTTQADFDAAERRLLPGQHLVTRVGTGFDVHAFAAGDHVWLGGVRIAHTRGVSAHSDGDVVLHALTDALLGALADGDIGSHFPPGDPQWQGASSDRFLAHALGLLHARGGILDHLDATVICETPKVGPHREAIRARIAGICGIGADRVSVKATTSERLGFTGRAEGIAAQAAATVRLPER